MEKGLVQAEQQNAAHMPYEQDLYGALLLMSKEHQENDVEEYIETQETTHIAEGLELQQTSIRTLDYQNGSVRGFGSVSMAEINRDGYRVAKKDYLAGNTKAFCLVRRREHDIAIAERADKLMAEGQIGDTLLVASPYQEEQDDDTARKLGFWPEF